MDESGVIWYGLKTDKDNCIKTGVTVPLHEKTAVTIVENKVGEAGPVVGWDITIDNVTTHLSVLDALTISSSHTQSQHIQCIRISFSLIHITNDRCR